MVDLNNEKDRQQRSQPITLQYSSFHFVANYTLKQEVGKLIYQYRFVIQYDRETVLLHRLYIINSKVSYCIVIYARENV